MARPRKGREPRKLQLLQEHQAISRALSVEKDIANKLKASAAAAKSGPNVDDMLTRNKGGLDWEQSSEDEYENTGEEVRERFEISLGERAGGSSERSEKNRYDKDEPNDESSGDSSASDEIQDGGKEPRSEHLQIEASIRRRRLTQERIASPTQVDTNTTSTSVNSRTHLRTLEENHEPTKPQINWSVISEVLQRILIWAVRILTDWNIVRVLLESIWIAFRLLSHFLGLVAPFLPLVIGPILLAFTILRFSDYLLALMPAAVRLYGWLSRITLSTEILASTWNTTTVIISSFTSQIVGSVNGFNVSGAFDMDARHAFGELTGFAVSIKAPIFSLAAYCFASSQVKQLSTVAEAQSPGSQVYEIDQLLENLLEDCNHVGRYPILLKQASIAMHSLTLHVSHSTMTHRDDIAEQLRIFESQSEVSAFGFRALFEQIDFIVSHITTVHKDTITSLDDIQGWEGGWVMACVGRQIWGPTWASQAEEKTYETWNNFLNILGPDILDLIMRADTIDLGASKLSKSIHEAERLINTDKEVTLKNINDIETSQWWARWFPKAKNLDSVKKQLHMIDYYVSASDDMVNVIRSMRNNLNDIQVNILRMKKELNYYTGGHWDKIGIKRRSQIDFVISGRANLLRLLDEVKEDHENYYRAWSDTKNQGHGARLFVVQPLKPLRAGKRTREGSPTPDGPTVS